MNVRCALDDEPEVRQVFGFFEEEYPCFTYQAHELCDPVTPEMLNMIVGVLKEHREALQEIRSKVVPLGYDSGDSGVLAICDKVLRRLGE